ncbi:MAG: exosortase/archaeosortase family protein [Chthoniobacteraceae bacterium]
MNHRWRGFVWISILTFLLIWAGLITSLSAFWSTDPQYAFGWTVPALSLFLLWECWNTRPAPAPPQRRGVTFFLAAIFAASLLPVYVLLEATPDWRFAHWAFASIVVGLSLCAVHLTGGGPWLRCFAFPVAFIFVSIPWPVKIEQAVIQTFTDWVSSLTVGGLNLCDVPAIQKGNLIEISTGTVGVEEACSGVRSFQATIMAALFLGQLWTFPLRSRFVLLGAGVVFAFFCNVARALILSFVAEKRGLAAIDRWHDPAGFAILGVCFLGLLGLALLLRPKFGRSLAPAETSAPQSLPAAFTVTLAVWAILVAAGTELWYRSAPPPNAQWWRVEWPEKKPAFAEIPLSFAVKQMKFDTGRQAHWREDDGTNWTMFHFRWLPGLATTRIAARWHNPDICLVAAGFKRIAEYEPIIIRKGDIGLVFRTYRFDAQDRKNYVFFCVWEDRRDPAEELRPPEGWNPASRIRAVLQRKRHLGQQVLEVAISGIENEQDARAAFERRIAALLQPDSIFPDDITAPDPAATTAR